MGSIEIYLWNAKNIDPDRFKMVQLLIDGNITDPEYETDGEDYGILCTFPLHSSTSHSINVSITKNLVIILSHISKM